LYNRGTYEKGTIHYLQKNLKNGEVFLDIGANIGLMSTIASKCVGKDGKVFSIEANPKTASILSHNLSLNQCDNATILQVALGNEEGTATLYENWSVNRGGASLLSQEKNASGVDVSLTTLDSIFDLNQSVAMIKLDVEGFELEVLKGGQNLIKNQLPEFCIEISSEREHEKGVTGKEVLEFLKSLGPYRFYTLSKTKERVGTLVEVMDLEKLPKHDNVFCKV
jgi:FkbM family methyltransferase